MENTKRQNAMKFVLLGIMLTISASIVLYLFPTEYDEKFDGISYRFDELKKIEDVELKLVGQFKRHFFKGDEFNGVFYINDRIYDQANFTIKSSLLGYTVTYDNGIKQLGRLYFSDSDRSFSLVLFEDISNFDVKSSLIITTGVSHRMDAMKHLKQHMKEDF